MTRTILEALNAHRVRLQGSIGRQVRAKKTPILTFKPDEVIRAAEHIEQILAGTGHPAPRPPTRRRRVDDDATPTTDELDDGEIEVNPELEERGTAGDGTA